MLSKRNFKEVPEVDLKMGSKEIKPGIRYVPWIIVTTPYMIVSDKEGTRKVWTTSKWKIFLYYAYQITGIKWCIKQYNK